MVQCTCDVQCIFLPVQYLDVVYNNILLFSTTETESGDTDKETLSDLKKREVSLDQLPFTFEPRATILGTLTIIL